MLHIDESGKGKLTFEENGSVIECYFVSEQGYCASVYDIEALENNRLGLYPEEYYERWAYSKTTKDSFTIVVEKSTFFEVGDKITFNKIMFKTGDKTGLRQGTVLCVGRNKTGDEIRQGTK